MSRKQNDTQKPFEPIAIVGVGALFPGSTDSNGFWNSIVHGEDLISEVPPSHWLIDDYYHPDPQAVDKTYCKRGAFLKDFSFNPIEYGIPPQVIPSTDTAQLLALIVAKEALGDVAKKEISSLDLSRVSVIVGSSTLEAIQFVSARMQRPVWNKALLEFGIEKTDVDKICDRISAHYTPWQESTFPGLLSNVVAGRIANRFNLGGTNCTVDAACAGSLAAFSMAVSELQLGQADMAITGGIDALNDIIMFMCFSKTHALSLAGDCRPFSDKADGTVLGEGLGLFALKRLSDAEKEGNKIYALIKGIGTSSDGRSKSIYAPVSQGQSKAILRAYDIANFSSDTVELIEAHGTGTKAGDVAEFNGLSIAFNERGKNKKRFCALGSVKSQIGHTKSAAGAAGLFKAIMALHHKVLPPTIKADQPNSNFDWKNSPFYLNTATRPWIRAHGHPRRAGVSSFGFGGSNYHVALEEYTGPCQAQRLRTFPTELIIFAADNPQALLTSCKALLEKNPEEISLSYLAYTTQKEFDPRHLARLTIIAKNNGDLREKITTAIQTIKSAPEQSFIQTQGVYYGYAVNPGKVAFVSPEIGCEYLGMGADLAMGWTVAMAAWEKAASHHPKLNEVVFPPPVLTNAENPLLEQQLHALEWAKPALAVTHSIFNELMKALQIYPDCVIEGKPSSLKQQIEKNYQTGVRTWIEVGPQDLSTQKVKQLLAGKEYHAISMDRKEMHGVTALWHALGHLIAIGLNPNVFLLWDEYRTPKQPVKLNNEHAVLINGTNYGKPYPNPDRPLPPIHASVKLVQANDETNIDYLTEEPMSDQSSLIKMYQELQKQLVDAHNTYQKTMSESHIAFLNSVTQLGNQVSVPNSTSVSNFTLAQPVATTIVAAPPQAPKQQPAPQPKIEPVRAPVMVQAAPSPMSVAPKIAPVAAPEIKVEAPVLTAKPVANNKIADLKNLLLNVVAEKTGYPTDMLNVDMAIEADLGIDSIKRVEILSALTERVPGLPEMDTRELAELQTLGHIISHVEKRLMANPTAGILQ